jgi:hypothetical protein
MPTKYSKQAPNADIPISISEEDTKPDSQIYFCSDCRRDLVLMNAEDGEYYCKTCSISSYPDHEDVRTRSRLSTPIGLNLEPCLSYAPDANSIPKHVEPEGAIKALKDKGIKITHYEERGGDGRPIKRDRWS